MKDAVSALCTVSLQMDVDWPGDEHLSTDIEPIKQGWGG